MTGSIDDAHAPFAEQGLEPVTPGHDLPEIAVLRRAIGRGARGSHGDLAPGFEGAENRTEQR
ncbi:hypothetical protein DB32_001522 [Sandaracinus amylolyticus]|uniref:Uncharacterized protein n=1 Tax=Sandaracinus amylolyticus TaxID=927083 RepID=A0A0F6W0K5_9BACT|nr:hypothetical protein DB32_001522 [Sandaracinus amylolyticus]